MSNAILASSIKIKQTDLKGRLMTELIGIDIGDKINFVCILYNKEEILFRKEIRNAKEDMREYFQSIENASIVFEVGSHSPWISRIAHCRWAHCVYLQS